MDVVVMGMLDAGYPRAEHSGAEEIEVKNSDHNLNWYIVLTLAVVVVTSATGFVVAVC